MALCTIAKKVSEITRLFQDNGDNVNEAELLQVRRAYTAQLTSKIPNGNIKTKLLKDMTGELTVSEYDEVSKLLEAPTAVLPTAKLNLFNTPENMPEVNTILGNSLDDMSIESVIDFSKMKTQQDVLDRLEVLKKLQKDKKLVVSSSLNFIEENGIKKLLTKDHKESVVLSNVDDLLKYGDAVSYIVDNLYNSSHQEDGFGALIMTNLLSRGNLKFEGITLNLNSKNPSSSGTSGNYSPDTNSIQLYPENIEVLKRGDRNPIRVLLHEAVHAVTVTTMQNDSKLKKKFRSIMNRAIQEDPTIQKEYAFMDEFEFVAEVLSNDELQNRLASIKGLGNSDTLLDTIREFFRELTEVFNVKAMEKDSLLMDSLNEIMNMGRVEFKPKTDKDIQDSIGKALNSIIVKIKRKVELRPDADYINDVRAGIRYQTVKDAMLGFFDSHEKSLTEYKEVTGLDLRAEYAKTFTSDSKLTEVEIKEQFDAELSKMLDDSDVGC